MAFRQMQGPPGYDEFQQYQATDVMDPSHQLLDYNSYVNSPYVEVFPSYEGYLATYQRARNRRDRYGDLYTRVMQGQSIEDELARPSAPMGSGTVTSMGRPSGRPRSEFEVSRDIMGKPTMEIKGGRTDILGRKTATTLPEAQAVQRLAGAKQEIALAPAARAIQAQEMQDKMQATVTDAGLNRQLVVAKKQEELANIAEQQNVRARAADKAELEKEKQALNVQKYELAVQKEKRIADLEKQKLEYKARNDQTNREFKKDMEDIKNSYKFSQMAEDQKNKVALLQQRFELADQNSAMQQLREMEAELAQDKIKAKQMQVGWKKTQLEAKMSVYQRIIEDASRGIAKHADNAKAVQRLTEAQGKAMEELNKLRGEQDAVIESVHDTVEPTRIRVRSKETGKVGTINSTDFNPYKYIRL